MPVSFVVVDDDPGFRRVAATLLAARGMRVVAQACDAAEGLTAIAEHQPQAVLLDLNLPDSNGLEVAARLLHLPASPVVILTSADAVAFTEQELRGCGVRAFMGKDRLLDADWPALLSTGRQ